MYTSGNGKTFVMTSSTIILFLCFTQIRAAYHIVPRIANGGTAISGQFPFAAALNFTTNNGTYFCGGSIISDTWILTAAHCLEGANKVQILLGVTDLNEAATNGSILRSGEYVIHPKYNPDILENDIGLVSLSSNISFNELIQPIELPTETLGPAEDTLVFGWGFTKNGGDPSFNQLYYTNLTTIFNAVCRKTYGKPVKDNMVYAVGEGIHGVCQGDGGGPLIKTTDKKRVQVGIVSFGTNSSSVCETSHPAGFTRVFEYVDWIKNVTERTSESEGTTEATESPTDKHTGEETQEPTDISPTESPNVPTQIPTEEPSSQPPENNSSSRMIMVNLLFLINNISIILHRNIN